MASNEYQRYLESQQHNNKEENSIGRTLLAGAAIVGAGVGVASSSRARSLIRDASMSSLDAANSGLNRLRSSGFRDGLAETSMIFKAMDDAIDTKGPLYHLKNPNRYQRRFQESLSRSIEGRDRSLRTALGGKATKAENLFFGVHNNMKMLRGQIVREMRYQNIVKDLQQRMPEKMQDGLHAILNQQDDSFFKYADHESITDLIEKYNKPNASKAGYQHSLDFKDDIEKDKFVKDLLGTVKAYQDDGILDKKQFNESFKLGQKRLFESLKKELTKKDSFFDKMMESRGLSQVTWKDAREMGLWEGDSIQKPVSRGRGNQTHVDAHIGKKMDTYATRVDSSFDNLIVDPYLYKDKHGKLHDYRKAEESFYKTMTGFQEHVQVPWLNFNPVDLMHWSTYQSVREAPSTYFFQRGNIDPILNSATKNMGRHPMAHMQDAAVSPMDRSYMYSGGQVFDVLNGEVIKDNVYLASARFGMVPRMMSGVSNLHRYDYRQSGPIRRLFDFGQQEHQSMWGQMASVVTKFDDPNWTPNAISRLFTDEGKTNSDWQVQAFKMTHSDLDTHAKELSDDVLGEINEYASRAYGGLGIDLKNMDDPTQVMDALGKIAKNMRSEDIGKSEELASTIHNMWDSYSRNPAEFMRGKRILSSASPYHPGIMQNIDASQTEVIDKVADARRLLHQHAIQQIESREGVKVGALVREAVNEGRLGRDALNEVSDLQALTAVRKYWSPIYNGTKEARQEAAAAFTQTIRKKDSAQSEAILKAIDRNANMLSAGPGDKPPQYFGRVGYMTMNKARGYQHGLEQFNEMVKQGENPLNAGVKGAWSVLGQPFAGRKNINDVTTATMPFYYYAERLDNALSKVGLGLSQQNRGSMQSILFNQMGRRVVLPYMAMQQAMYVDGLTGDFFSDQAADAYVNMHTDTAAVKDLLGINKLYKHMENIMPGSELLWQNPIGSIMKHASFGLVGDSRSTEELERYYESGEDPIRKGRYWSIGSNTPWQGGKIDHYAPNWYRQLKSDWKFTDTLYGDEGEYWANHWMPTLTNPLAPIKRFILDADHYENKHAESRPYAIQGGIPELQMLPLVGPALDNTIGRLVKPRTTHPDLEKSHREYLEGLNNYYASQYEAAIQGGYMQTLPGGGHRILSGVGGYGNSVSVAGSGGASGAIGYGMAGAGGSGGGKGGISAQEHLAAINMGIASQAGAGGLAPSINSLDSLRDPNIQADLADIGNPSGVKNTIEQSWYSLTEMAGIYGFSVNTLLGYDEAGRGMVLDPSSRMMSYSRQFWDMELGGLGGEVSEIGRRYNPRDKGNYYNPIRNTMPEWLPGPEYFVDFQHGDPYVKIKRGEMRLPGKAYESLYQLHPDQFGRYGAFDRFKILSDVAPYSDQYKFYRRVVSQMNQKDMLTEGMEQEYSEIRDQTTEKKKTYNLFPRKFRDADIKQEEVTVSRVLDANTFIASEYPNHPIKLAGVSVREDATEAREWMSQYIHEGAKLRIGLDADPLFRVRDDTMETMRAVVYANKHGDNRFFFESQKGQSINAILSRRGFDGVTTKDDGSATSTAALYDGFDRKIGSTWEFVTHDVLPAIPIVNVVADKFLQLKSPLEMYKQRHVYGKDWKPWYDPWGGWIEPMLDKAAEQNPLVAAAGGYGAGWMFGRSQKGKFYGKWAGALTFGLLASKRVLNEFAGRLLPDGSHADYTWIPERRRKQRAIDEYFDKLKYAKYKGLYEKASQIALEKEGVNIDKLLDESTKRGEDNKRYRNYLSTMKKWLAIEEKRGYVDEEFIRERKEYMQDELSGINEDRGLTRLGKYSTLALQYRAQYESTLYGADPHGDMQKIYRALPDVDKEFFNHFMNASPEDREEILRLVPQNQRRFYQARWGLKMDSKENLRAYFTTHNLPGASWEGWRPDVSLDDIKVKVVQNEGMETTEFGLWQDDVKRAEMNDAPEIQPFRPSNLIDVTRIQRVLRGAGLDDVEVTMNVTNGGDKHNVGVSLDLMKDRSREILSEINNNMGSLI